MPNLMLTSAYFCCAKLGAKKDWVEPLERSFLVNLTADFCIAIHSKNLSRSLSSTCKVGESLCCATVSAVYADAILSAHANQ